MKNYFLIIILFSFSFGGFAQLENNKKVTVEGLGIPAPKKEIPKEKPETPEIKKAPENGLFLNRPPITLTPEKDQGFRMLQDDGLLDYRIKDFVPKAFKKDKEIREEFKNDQYLGDFTTTGSFVELYCRDHEYVDGDKVRVFVNGEMINNSISLGSGYTPVLVKLKEGFNTVIFEALNMGASGPNTAELQVLDEDGNLITTKEWNLTTGTKAKLIVVKK